MAIKKWESHWFKWDNTESKKLWTSVLKNREPIDPAYKIIADIAKKNGKTVLDIACGGGVQGKKLIENKMEYYGIDVSPSNIKTCKELFQTGNFSLGDASALEFKNNEFDVTIIRHLIEHHPPENASTILSEGLRVSKNCFMVLFFRPPIINGKVKILKAGSGVYLNNYTQEWILNHMTIPKGYRVDFETIKIKKPNSKFVLTNQELYVFKKIKLGK